MAKVIADLPDGPQLSGFPQVSFSNAVVTGPVATGYWVNRTRAVYTERALDGSSIAPRRHRLSCAQLPQERA
jgi:hypothetical protein